MRWQLGRRSSNIEDRRGFGGGGIALGGGGMVLLAIVAMFMGVDPSVILNGIGQPQAPSGEEAPSSVPEGDEQADFVAAILGDTEDTWQQIFSQGLGTPYEPPHLVLFTEAVQSACGFGSAAVGPFYCPADRKVYLDLSFFRDLDQRFGAPGDDRLQRRQHGTVQPESWTHGSSEQRVRWLRRGLETGRVDACNTFAAEKL